MNALIVGPLAELLFREFVDLPAFVLQELGRQLLHLAGLVVERPCVLVEMEVNGNLIVLEHKVQLHKAVVADKLRREDQAVTVHEYLKVHVFPVLLVVGV